MICDLETHLSMLVGRTPLNRAAPDQPGDPQPTCSLRGLSALAIPAVGDCVTQELLSGIEAQLPNVAASRSGLRALRARLIEQISDAKELRSRFPDSFLHRLIEPCARRETRKKS